MCLRNFGNKIKMIYSLLLSGVLLLLFSAGSSSYCRELSVDDVKNFYFNHLHDRYSRSIINDTKTSMDSFDSITLNLVNKANVRAGHWALSCSGGTLMFSVFWNNNPMAYYRNGTLNGVQNGQYTGYHQTLTFYYNDSTHVITLKNNGIEENGSIYVDKSEGHTIYTDGVIYTDYNLNSIWMSAETTYPSNFDVFAENYYYQDVFSFNYNSILDETITFNRNGDTSTAYVLERSNYYTYMATFGMLYNLGGISRNMEYYNKNLGEWELFINDSDYDNYTSTDDIGYLYNKQNDFIANTFLYYYLVPNDFDRFTSQVVLLYLVDDNTVINNGVLDINGTFNNNYYNKYIYDINKFIDNNSGGMITNSSGDVTGYVDLQPITNGIQDIKDTLVDGSQTENIINSYISGDLPDVFGYQENFKTEYTLFWTPLNYLSTQIFNALTLNSTAVFNIPLRNGQTLVLRSSDFTVPDGPLKSFISLYLVFSTVYVVFLSFRRLIDNLNSAGISGVLEKQGVDPDYVKM